MLCDEFVAILAGQQRDATQRLVQLLRLVLDSREALSRLGAAVDEAAEVLRKADSAKLLEPTTIQGMAVTGMEAAYHAVEHFSMHAGQILWITKLRTGEDLGFYRIEDGQAERRW